MNGSIGTGIILISLLCLSSCSSAIRGQIYPASADPGIPVIVPERDSIVEAQSAERIARGLYTAPPQSSGADIPLVVILHGNGETILGMAPLARRFAAAGCATLLVEYPGWGADHGRVPTEAIITEDAAALIWEIQRVHFFLPENTVCYGYSLGGAVAAVMAERGLCGRLVLQSTFTSMVDMGAEFYPRFLSWLLMPDRWNTIERTEALAMPVLLLHGTQDSLIPPSMSRRLADRLSDARYIQVEGAGHNDLWDYATPAVWEETLGFVLGEPRE